MFNNNSRKDTDPSGQFIGYNVDLINELQAKLGFTYSLSLSPSGKYGGRNEHGSYSGMYGELMRKVTFTHYFDKRKRRFLTCATPVTPPHLRKFVVCAR